jgi:CPA2 family monovalent cation:H+ antiporter-2
MHVLADLLLVMTISVIIVYAFQRVKLPPVSGFLLSGILLGPGVTGLVGDVHVIELLAEIGVALLLFTIGLEFSLAQLNRMKWLVLGAGSGQMLATIGVVFLVCRALGLPLRESIFFGFLFSLSSTAIVLKLLGESRSINDPHGRLMMAILLFQDLAVVPLMLLTPVLGGKGESASTLVSAIFTSLGVVVGILIAAVWVSPWILSKVVHTRSREVFVLTVLVLSLGTAWVTQQAGLSLALGAFLAGIAISSSEYNHQALTEVLPFRDVSSSLFFVSVGMLVVPSTWVAAPLQTVALFVGLILLQAFLVFFLAVVFGFGVRVAVLAGLGLAQVGEFAFILAKFGQNYELLTPAHYQIFLSISVLTMLFTPFAFLLAAKVAPIVANRFSFLEKLSLVRMGSVQAEEAESLQDHVLIIGFGLNGKNVAQVLRQSKTPYAILELNPVTVSSMREQGEAIFYGDATRAEVLRHMGIEKARVLVSVIQDTTATLQIVTAAKMLNPKLDIIARTRYVTETEDLYKAGVRLVIVEELETSRQVVDQVLRCYAIPEETQQTGKENPQSEFVWPV